MEEIIICKWCENEINDEKDCYDIEELGFCLCESCMTLYLDGPTEEDDLDDLMEELSLETK
jgi:hypothetical protein